MVIYFIEIFLIYIFYKILKMLLDELLVIGLFVIWFIIIIFYLLKILLINDIGFLDSLIFFIEFLVNFKWFFYW